MTEQEFAAWVAKVSAICASIEDYSTQCKAIDEALAACPEFWREPVRVMAQGGYYYSADDWMAKHARIEDKT